MKRPFLPGNQEMNGGTTNFGNDVTTPITDEQQPFMREDGVAQGSCVHEPLLKRLVSGNWDSRWSRLDG